MSPGKLRFEFRSADFLRLILKVNIEDDKSVCIWGSRTYAIFFTIFTSRNVLFGDDPVGFKSLNVKGLPDVIFLFEIELFF